MNNILKGKLSFSSYIRANYEAVVFVVYVILLSVAISRHEPWMDEAQAWLLAKDLGLAELFIKYLRYEGSPGLWHLILMIPAKLGLPYFSVNIIAAFFSAIGTAIFLRYAPFPRIVKILYPFSFFVFFQYGVVARSYCLIAPVLFLIALNYDKKDTHPFRFVLLLSLLANISAHTFLIAGSIAFIHFIDVLKNWSAFNKQMRTRQLFALTFFGLVALLVIFIIITPPDQIYAGAVNWGVDNFVRITKRMVGGSFAVNEASKLTWLSGSISAVIFVITAFWLRKNKLLMLYLLPLLLLTVLFAIKYRNWWHQGVLFLLWIFVLWIGYQRYHSGPRVPLARTLIGGLTFVLVVQVYWCFDSLAYDFKNSYSGSRSLANYIKFHKLQQEKIYVSGWRTISVLPYFSKNIFYNHNNGSSHRFWNWSINNVTSVGATPPVLDTIGCEQPGVVIFASDHIRSGQKIELPGYKATAFFKGYLCWKTGVIEPECFLLFKRMTDEEKQQRRQQALPEADEKIVYQKNGLENKAGIQ